MVKAVGLFSGGLDSALAIKLMQKQGIKVIALNFVSPFCTCVGKGCSIAKLAKKLGVPIKLMDKGKEYLKIVRHPKHGYGKNMNPCIDCKIFILKKAKKYAEEIGAKFIFTGEVIGQRPMSQTRHTMDIIEREAGLKGKLVRPLCAKHMPETEAEKKGWIDRKKLLDFHGRVRVPQLELAKKYKVDGFLCGGSGCRLTNEGYCKKIKDLFDNKKNINMNDVRILNFGRHFRKGKNKILVGKDDLDNKNLLKLKKKEDYVFMAKDDAGPTTILQGPKTKEAIKIAASLTARYSDSEKKSVKIIYGKGKINKEISVNKAKEEEIRDIRV